MGAFSRRSRASSTPPCEAASISTTSRCWPSRTATHCSHVAAGFGGRALLAVDHLGQDPGGRGLPGPPGAAEQERVRQPALANRPGQRPDHVVLPEDLVRALGAVLPVERLVLSSANINPRSSVARKPPGEVVVAVHPPSTRTDSSASPAGSSGQASPRHPPAPAYGCSFRVLTGFAGWRRAGPDLQRPVPGATRARRASGGDSAPLKRIAGTGHRWLPA